MNLQPSDAELRVQTQHITTVLEDRGDRSPNPFVAALGIGAIVAIIWSLYIGAEFISRVASTLREWL